MREATATIHTPIGPVLAVATDEGLTALRFDPEAEAHDSHPVLDLTRAELDAYFRGDLRDFTVPVAQAGTDFQHRVWAELRRIPYGHTISYAQLAARVGNPSAVRAVGGANGANNVPIIVPCHRVIASDGTLGGFGGGLDRKRWLLSREHSSLFNPAVHSRHVSPAL
ncbi:MAG: methylated-DNA--[protein]-cysteine S-methyltransferase [Leptolyngbya sp. PLA1]|nr:methylated-DNA--[protein]-cysteine S-methyltransferase [Leptolyngbya sp. PLA1]